MGNYMINSFVDRTDISDDGSYYSSFPQNNINTEIDSKVPKFADIKSISGITYTIISDDNAKILEFITSGVTITLSTGFTKGFQSTIVNYGGSVLFVADNGVEIKSREGGLNLVTQYNAASVYYRGNNIWLVIGDLTT
jgi:hypothetical protein